MAALQRMRLIPAGANPVLTKLPGGVSSDIWHVQRPEGPICVKRALPRLKVDAVWEVPTERNDFEWAWMKEVAQVEPLSIPPLIAQDSEAGCFAMGFLDSAVYPSWKEQLRRGSASVTTAHAVGRQLVSIHTATADRDDLAKRFATDHIFHAIRIEPYLLATAERHPDVGTHLRAVADETSRTKRVLVHGDVSPKNILVGPNGPVFLDAECAWYGDPAFDLAFCLNHLLLKCLWNPSATLGFLDSFDALAQSYLNGVGWEPRRTIECRVARLLPGLFLARVDGKSPVEYLTRESERERVRRVAKALLKSPVDSPLRVRQAWTTELEVGSSGPNANHP